MPALKHARKKQNLDILPKTSFAVALALAGILKPMPTFCFKAAGFLGPLSTLSALESAELLVLRGNS